MALAINTILILIDQLMLFVVNLLVAHKVDQALFGDFVTAVQILLFLSVIATLGVDSVLSYYVPKYFQNKKYSLLFSLLSDIKKFLNSLYLLIFLVGLFSCLIVITMGVFFVKVSIFEVSHPTFLFLWGLVIISMYTIFLQLLRCINYMRLSIFFSFLQTLVYFILAVIISFYIFPTYFSGRHLYFPHLMLLGFFISYSLIVIPMVTIIKNFKDKIIKTMTKESVSNPQWKNKAIGYTIQSLGIYIFTTIPLVSMEIAGRDESSVGLFAVIISIISLACIAIQPINILISPEISAAYSTSKEKLLMVLKRALTASSIIGIIITTMFFIFAKPLLKLYPSEFSSVLFYVYLCLFNIMLYALSLPFSRVIQYSHKGNLLGAKITIFYLILQTVLSTIFSYFYDLQGAVFCLIAIRLMYTLTSSSVALIIIKNYDIKHYQT